jgi:translation initiation factor IF-2
VAGTTWCRVRQMTDDKGKSIKEATPGMPVIVAGWKDVPVAGDEMLEAINGENDAKKAVANRQRDVERKALMRDVEKINEKRRSERERLEQERIAAEAVKAEGGDPVAAAAAATRAAEANARANAFKELRLIIKADVSGTVEAVVGSLEGIGNKEAGVKIIGTGVGDVCEADVALADAAEGGLTILLSDVGDVP